jgi:hypothetical protein
LDAFPVHQFTYTSSGWRERLVDVNGKASGEIKPPVKPHVSGGNPRIEHAKAAVLARMAAKNPKPDPSNAADLAETEEDNCFNQKNMDEEAAGFHFRLVLSNAETPAVRLLLTGSEDRLRRNALEQAVFGQGKDAELKPINPADLPPPREVVKPKVGEGIEVCPLAIATCEDIASRVVKAGGAALLFDYGEDHAQSDSLRAFQKHTQVSFLSQVPTCHHERKCLNLFYNNFSLPLPHFDVFSPDWWMSPPMLTSLFVAAQLSAKARACLRCSLRASS